MRGRSSHARPARVARIAGVLSGVVAAFVGCIDLFHSTEFGTCLTDGGPGCVMTDGGGVVTYMKDGGHDAQKTGPSDATVTDTGHDAGRDAADVDVMKVDSGADSAVHDASHETGHVDAGHDASTFVDADFCDWNAGMAQTNAAHACLWLGACAGDQDLNAFGTCYPNALLAYNCKLNPNMQVKGPLHAYWNGLWQAKSCADVIEAILPGGPPCSNPNAACGTDLQDGGAFGAVVVGCGSDGGFVTAVNCDMAGYVCVGPVVGHCQVASPADCSDSPSPTCSGAIFHLCASVDGGASQDFGQDCTNFGAGHCFPGTTTAGCAPGDQDASCTVASAHATCGDEVSASGCVGSQGANGVETNFDCAEFTPDTTCNMIDVPSSNPVRLCSTPSSSIVPGCDGGAVVEYAGPAGVVHAGCADAGLGACSGGACIAPSP